MIRWSQAVCRPNRSREVSELLAARLTDRPLVEQMKEFTDVCRQVEAVKTAMITEISKGKKKKEETVVVTDFGRIS